MVQPMVSCYFHHSAWKQLRRIDGVCQRSLVSKWKLNQRWSKSYRRFRCHLQPWSMVWVSRKNLRKEGGCVGRSSDGRMLERASLKLRLAYFRTVASSFETVRGASPFGLLWRISFLVWLKLEGSGLLRWRCLCEMLEVRSAFCGLIWWSCGSRDGLCGWAFLLSVVC